MIKRVLVTGASGNIGFHVVKELLGRKDDYKTRVLILGTKSEHKMFEPYKSQLEIVEGDIRDIKIIKKTTEDVDFIIHLAAVIPPTADKNPAMAYEVNVIGTKNILEVMDSGTKLLYSSSISVYGDRVNNPWIKVTDPLKPSLGDEYAKTKIEAEKLIRNSGMNWIIFRLSAISNPNYHLTPIVFHVPLDTKIEFCLAEDVGLAFVKALKVDDLYGKIFNLGGGEKCRTTYFEFLREVFKIYNISPQLINTKLFAKKNFHCGYYVDSGDLEELLHFQRGTINDYYKQLDQNLSSFNRLVYKVVPSICIKKYFEKMSEPFQALKNNDSKSIQRYFGD
ncbi:MAG: NAD-dependent epimerase/dehydratase family protein [Candidatus Hodarchaeales archaeon]